MVGRLRKARAFFMAAWKLIAALCSSSLLPFPGQVPYLLQDIEKLDACSNIICPACSGLTLVQVIGQEVHIIFLHFPRHGTDLSIELCQESGFVWACLGLCNVLCACRQHIREVT